MSYGDIYKKYIIYKNFSHNFKVDEALQGNSKPTSHCKIFNYFNSTVCLSPNFPWNSPATKSNRCPFTSIWPRLCCSTSNQKRTSPCSRTALPDLARLAQLNGNRFNLNHLQSLRGASAASVPCSRLLELVKPDGMAFTGTDILHHFYRYSI